MPEKKKDAEPIPPKTVRVQGDLHRRAKLYGVLHNLDVQEMVNEALAEYLKKRGA